MSALHLECNRNGVSQIHIYIHTYERTYVRLYLRTYGHLYVSLYVYLCDKHSFMLMALCTYGCTYVCNFPLQVLSVSVFSNASYAYVCVYIFMYVPCMFTCKSVYHVCAILQLLFDLDKCFSIPPFSFFFTRFSLPLLPSISLPSLYLNASFVTLCVQSICLCVPLPLSFCLFRTLRFSFLTL